MPPKGKDTATRKSVTAMRHAAVIRLIGQGMAGWRAYQKVYGCKEIDAKRNAYRIFTTENEGMKQALIDAGMDPFTVAQVAMEGLNAKKVVTATEKGVITDEKEYADYQTRAKWADIWARVNGVYSPEKKEISGSIDLNKVIAEQDEPQS